MTPALTWAALARCGGGGGEMDPWIEEGGTERDAAAERRRSCRSAGLTLPRPSRVPLTANLHVLVLVLVDGSRRPPSLELLPRQVRNMAHC